MTGSLPQLTKFSEGHWQLRIGRRFRVSYLRGEGLLFWHPSKPRPSFSIGRKGFFGFRRYDA